MDNKEPQLNDHGEPEVKPLFRSGEEYDPISRGKKRDSLNPSDLSDKERSDSGLPGGSSAESAEKSGLYSGTEKGGGLTKWRGRLTRNVKRRVAIAGAAGVLGFGGIAGFSIIQGPLQAIHLGQVLSNSFSHTDETNGIRTQGIYRYLRTGNIGETHLGFFGSKVNSKVIADLEKNGIKINTNEAGRPKSINIDKRSNPGLSGMSHDDARSTVAKAYGVEPNKIVVSGNGNMTVDLEGARTGVLRKSVLKSLDLAGKGKISTALNGRIVTKYFSVPSLFHPLKKVEIKLNEASIVKAKAKLQERKAGKEVSRAEAEQEARRQASIEKYNKYFTPNESAKGKISKIKSKLGSNKVIGAGAGALTGTAALCIAKDIATDIPEVNRATGAVPAALGAFNAMGIGSQAMSGDDLSIEQVGDFVSTFTDEDGKTIWQGKALNSLSGASSGSGIDLDDDVKQSFSPDTNTDFMEDALDALHADELCSPIGQVAQAALGIGLLVTTGGTGTIIVKGATGLATGIAVSRIIEYAKKYLADEPLSDKILAGGPLGGNLMAYGSEEADGIISRSMGGVAFSNEEGQAIRTAQAQKSKEEFVSQSFASRLFNVYDYRSVASTALHTQGGNISQIVNNNLANIVNFKPLTNIFSSAFSAKVFAQERTYDWSIPKYGFSDQILNDPKYQDPYENADLVAGLLDSDPDMFKDKLINCFGASIKKGAHGWQVVSEKDVNPTSKDYRKSNCAEQSNENWIRFRLFILDNKVIGSFACYEGVNEACDDIIGTETSETETDDSESGIAGDMTKTFEVKSPGEFITLPSKYSCPGRTTKIDSRIAPALAYILETYNLCADDGLANGHKSHGAGFGVDVRPKDQSKQNSKDEWKNTAEKFLRDINWWGDAADEPKSSKGCAKYSGYGNCVGGAKGPDGTIPKWVRWLGYNGDVDHGDPWHIFGGSYGHIHIGWQNPSNDAVSSSIIGSPRSSAYTFGVVIPEDIKPLLSDELLNELEAKSSVQITDKENQSSASINTNDSKELAKKILANKNVTYPYKDAAQGLTVKDVLENVVKTGKGIVNSSDVSYNSVAVNPNMLKAILEYAQNNKIGLNALTNADHSSNSNHYKGIAVDLACNPSVDLALFGQIASKYGGGRNGETCDKDAHWHYDFK